MFARYCDVVVDHEYCSRQQVFRWYEPEKRKSKQVSEILTVSELWRTRPQSIDRPQDFQNSWHLLYIKIYYIPQEKAVCGFPRRAEFRFLGKKRCRTVQCTIHDKLKLWLPNSLHENSSTASTNF